MTQVDTAQVDTTPTGQDTSGGITYTGIHRDNGSGTPRGRIRRAIRAASGPGPWERGVILAALAVLLGLFLLLHTKIPNQARNLGSLVETFLPWFGLFVPVLLVGALWRRSASAVIALVLPVTVWLSLFGGLLIDKSHAGGDLTVVSHNVGAENPDPVGTARALATSGADVLALEELAQQVRGAYEKELAKVYPHRTVLGTVGLWSKLPLARTRWIDSGMDYVPPGRTMPVGTNDAARALRTEVATRQGPLVIYVAHLGSVRVNPRAGFSTSDRDRGVRALSKTIAADRSERVVLLGDLNGTMYDRTFATLTSQLRSTHAAAGDGFGFSWPAKFPVARIDQILVRGVEPRSSWVLPATGSDHLPVAAALNL
jgi:vancomycin resistance protein VanJ